VGDGGAISFVFGSATASGLDPANFASGTSRFLDVADNTGTSVLAARIPLNAAPFALSPGPAGPQGPPGQQGPPGPPGVVQSVAAGDSSIAVIGGATANPTVTVASSGITNAKVADGALSAAKIAGTAATQGTNAFVGNQSITGSLTASGSVTVGTTVSANAIAANVASIAGNTTSRGNGLDIQIGNVGCGPPTAGIGAGGVTCTTFALGIDGSASTNMGTYINRPTGGKIGFREGNSSEQMTIMPGGRVGIGTTSPQAQLHAVTTGTGVRGDGSIGVEGEGSSDLSSIGVSGSGNRYGVSGNGIKIGVVGGSNSGIGVLGDSSSTALTVAAVQAHNNLGGNLFIGENIPNTGSVFRVDGTGKVFANGGFQTGGADFAESFTVLGQRAEYEPGDLLIIDAKGKRRLALSAHPYSTSVAGIYSTKPGVLASPYEMDNLNFSKEVPLAVVGVVPCKVTAENGPIKPGDLLVTSSTPGHAMKGTNRRRILGAVVGKALEPLPSGKGIIQVLVTLQ
jgi:hypothetical protein